ncbi:CBS domain-containing protein [Streptomyces sp. NPDC047928]|uniref:CBS domain-containing protein n=1 Tax=unclassified Streptomyces TaxID=2593676 RepID=UPI00371A5BA5
MIGPAPCTVAEVMTRTVVAVGPDARFKEIVAAMRRWNVTGVPVLEGEGRVVGVVSEADLLPKEELRDEVPTMLAQRLRLPDYAKAGAVTAREAMSSPPVTVRPGATLSEAAGLMARHRVKRLPVVDEDGVLRGIVSRADLLKVFLRPDRDLAAQVRREVIDPLFAVSHRDIRVDVAQGRVTLSGPVRDAALIPVAERLTRAVEGVVAVHCELTAPQAAPAAPAAAPLRSAAPGRTMAPEPEPEPEPEPAPPAPAPLTSPAPAVERR